MKKKEITHRPFIFLWAILLFLGTPCLAAVLSDEITQTQQKIEELDKLEATPANKQIKDVYQQILALLQEQQGYIDKTKTLEQQLKDHTAKTNELKQSLERIPPPREPPAGKSLEELGKIQEATSREKISLQTQLDEVQKRLSNLQARLIPAQAELSNAKQALEQLAKESKSLSATLEGNLANALVLKRKRNYEAKLAQIADLNLELLSIPNQIEITGLERELISRKLKNLSQYDEKLQSLMQQARQAESKNIEAESRESQQTSHTDPALKWLAEDNTALGNKLASYLDKIQKISDRRYAIEQETNSIEKRFTLLKQELDLGGDTSSVGELMRETFTQFKWLGEEDTPKTISEIRKGQIQSLSLERQRNEISDRTAYIHSIVLQFPDSQLTAVDAHMREELNSLLEYRINLANKLLESNQQSLKELSLLLNAQNQFNDKFQQFNKLLKEKMLWTASNHPMSPSWLLPLLAGDWSISQDIWKGISEHLFLFALPITGLLFAFCFVAWFLRFSAHPRFNEWTAAVNENVGNVRRDSFRMTLLKMAGEFIFTLPAPLLLVGLRKIFFFYGEEEIWTRIVGDGLRIMYLGLFMLGYLRRLAKPGGVLERHLRWPASMSNSLYRSMRLRWLLVLLAAFGYVSALYANTIFWYETGRLAFLALCILIAIMARKFTRAWRNASKSGSWWNINESPHVLGSLFVLGEIWLAGMEVFGFHLGAIYLQTHLLATAGWTLAVVLAYQLLERWLLLERRRMAYNHAQAVRAELRAAKKEGEGVEEIDMESKRREFDEIESISLQSKALLKLLSGAALLIAVSWIWSDLVPAFQLLDQVALWETTTTGPEGSSIQTITLKSVFLSIVTLGLIILASKNLPGMIRLLVLPHLDLAPGTDFAVTTLLKYSINVTGVVVVCQLLGLRWEQLQWLIAALGVGLGFGLQEIFANFISGLIILFEKPVRIGDIVTLNNGVSGTIDTINTRATTMTDFDNKEIIIPNKTLITEQLTNWSLSSQVIRVIVPVGVAYGSDTELAIRLLLQAAEEHPKVLDKPEKAALFRTFGDSSLNFELRCFIADPGGRLGVIHDLNLRIDQLFREYGMEIPFPQRDVHIKEQGRNTNPQTLSATSQPAPRR